MTTPYKGAVQHAQRLHDKYGVINPEDIRLEDIAYAEGLSVVDGGVTGSDARLVLHNKQSGTIRVKAGVDRGRRRFSIAHEIGHFILHPNGLSRCSTEDLSTWHKGDRESQANAFAAEFILPSRMTRKYCEVDNISLAPAKLMAEKFHVSLTASLIRFVDLCPTPCAVIAAAADTRTIRWSSPSGADAQFPLRLPAWGDSLDPGALAAHLVKKNTQSTEPSVVGSHVWLEEPTKLPDHVEVYEDAVVLPSYNMTLSLVWLEGWDGEGED